MNGLIRYSVKLLLFWFLFFIPNRLFFILYQLPIGERIKHNQHIVDSFYRGYQLDLATAIILAGLPIILGIFYYIFQKKLWLRLSSITMLVLLVLYTAISLADAGIYKEWLAKVNVQALVHISNPQEVIKTISWQLQVLFVVLVLAFSIPFYSLYQKMVKPSLVDKPKYTLGKRSVFGFVFFLVNVGLGIIGIRGGITNLPISQSAAYFCTETLANDMAVNPMYNLLQDITIQGNIPEARQYHYRSEEEAKELIKDYFYIAKDSTEPILNTRKPNLVFIILESWSADLVGCLGGIKDATPCFDSLSKEGILFTKAIASAYISDQGIPAVLSGFPGLHRISAINQPRMINRMPSISEDLISKGYSTLFMYGGDLVFGNIKGYVVQKKYEQITDYQTLTNLPQGKLGVHDEYTFPELLRICGQSKSPFLNVLFTLSTHMPYDFKERAQWKSVEHDVEERYSQSVHYADAAIGAFFREAKKQSWYENTLFLLVADHSHNTYRQSDPTTPQRHHIPLLFLGGAIKKEARGRTINRYVAQMDIVSTLYHQMGMNADKFKWSRNMFNPYTVSAAYYPFYGGTGYVNDEGFAGYQVLAGSANSSFTDTTAARVQTNRAQSFLQRIYQEVVD